MYRLLLHLLKQGGLCTALLRKHTAPDVKLTSEDLTYSTQCTVRGPHTFSVADTSKNEKGPQHP